MSLTVQQLQRLRTLQGALSSLSHEYEDVIPLIQSAVKDGNDTAIGMLKDQTNGLAAIMGAMPTGYALQGSDATATNTAILSAVNSVDIDTSELAKLGTDSTISLTTMNTKLGNLVMATAAEKTEALADLLTELN